MTLTEKIRLLSQPEFWPKRTEGDQAETDGQPSTANPYPAGSGEAVNWDEGWKDARQRHS